MQTPCTYTKHTQKPIIIIVITHVDKTMHHKKPLINCMKSYTIVSKMQLYIDN